MVQQIGAVNEKNKELEQSVEELTSQLDDLLKAKNDDESVMLEKFRDLLNEKKLKIRQQQKLIESADVDLEKLQNVGASQRTMRKAGVSRTSKRKIKDEPLSEGESDDGFEKMDVDDQSNNRSQSSPDTEDERQTTDNDATESEPDNNETDAEEDEAPKPAPKSKPARSTRSRASKASPVPPKSTRTSTTSTRASQKPSQKPSEEPSASEPGEDIAPPPIRTLPFKTRAKKSAPTPAPAGDDETESDDEL